MPVITSKNTYPQADPSIGQCLRHLCKSVSPGVNGRSENIVVKRIPLPLPRDQVPTMIRNKDFIRVERRKPSGQCRGEDRDRHADPQRSFHL